jgi:hypothetical protein
MGSRGYRPHLAVLLGSMSRGVAMKAPLPGSRRTAWQNVVGRAVGTACDDARQVGQSGSAAERTECILPKCFS